MLNGLEAKCMLSVYVDNHLQLYYHQGLSLVIRLLCHDKDLMTFS